MKFTIDRFIEKYGTQTASLLIEKAARELPANESNGKLFHGLLEIAMDLRLVLQDQASKR